MLYMSAFSRDLDNALHITKSEKAAGFDGIYPVNFRRKPLQWLARF